MIVAPRIAAEDYDREIECELALEEDLRQLAVLAEVAGWRRQEAAWTLMQLATARYAGALKGDDEAPAPDTIAPPRIEGEYGRRVADCETAIRPAFQGLIADSVRAGWTGREAAFALIRLSGRLLAEAESRPEAVDPATCN